MVYRRWISGTGEGSDETFGGYGVVLTTTPETHHPGVADLAIEGRKAGPVGPMSQPLADEARIGCASQGVVEHDGNEERVGAWFLLDLDKEEASFDQRLALLLAMAMFVLVVDTSLMNVSISAVVNDLGTTVSSVQSAIALEALVSAAFILIGSKVGDLFGRKRAYVSACSRTRSVHRR